MTSGLDALGWARDLTLFHRSVSSLGRTVQVCSHSSDRGVRERAEIYKSLNMLFAVSLLLSDRTRSSPGLEGDHYQRVRTQGGMRTWGQWVHSIL